ncbi:hypothetical protein L3Q82_005275 [Scortum barcoo]|uniref:Uncharacterized protein n=1 Tax=Scortum barcoo TaxID=214431 RepID=A0ACB8V9I9_9TELE|nr:hypothetical protein L3Q82_005275 [Scortum barcoo]
MTFHETVVSSVVSYAVVYWGVGCSERDKKRLNRLIKRASSVCGCPLDSIEVMGERRALAKLSTIMDNTSHPLHQTVGALSSSFSNRLRCHPRCRKEHFRRYWSVQDQQDSTSLFIQNSMGLWKTTLEANFKPIAQVSIKCNIYQADALSPLLFCIGLNPLSQIITKTGYGYQLLNRTTISHLLYMDDI